MRERVKNVVALGTDASTYSDPVTPFGDLALLTADPRGRQRIWRRRREKKGRDNESRKKWSESVRLYTSPRGR